MMLQGLARGDVRHDTYVPPTYADVPSLWRRWQEEDAEASAASVSVSPPRSGSKLPSAAAGGLGLSGLSVPSFEPCPSSTPFPGHVQRSCSHDDHALRSVGGRHGGAASGTGTKYAAAVNVATSDAACLHACQPSSLKVLLKLQARRAQEAEVYDDIQLRNQRRHIRVLGKTEDLSKGRLDDLLAEARALTSDRSE